MTGNDENQIHTGYLPVYNNEDPPSVIPGAVMLTEGSVEVFHTSRTFTGWCTLGGTAPLIAVITVNMSVLLTNREKID